MYLASSEGNAFVQTSAVLKRGAGFLTLHHNPWKSKERQQQDSNWIQVGNSLSLCTVIRGTEPNAVGGCSLVMRMLAAKTSSGEMIAL